MAPRIVQVIPAAGDWFASSVRRGAAGVMRQKVACWALVEDEEGERWVEALVPAGGGFDLALASAERDGGGWLSDRDSARCTCRSPYPDEDDPSVCGDCSGLVEAA